jgi:RNA polymerase sigma-70 factor (ECF subfamily)
MTGEESDEELMLAMCYGDQSAYRILVKRHLTSISHYAFRLLGNQRDTEDISQEVFLRLWTNASKWQPKKARLSTWLHRIAHNLCIDFMRKHGRTVIDDEPTKLDIRDEDYTSSEQEPDTDDRTQRLNSALSTLPENQRSALMLCHYAGFSNKEAAAIMNVSVKALESNIARARRTLKDLLEENDTMRGDTETIG